MKVGYEGKTSTGTEVWLTPPTLIKLLGPFDLDPCAPIFRPWDTATYHYDIDDDGLIQPWFDRVWCNPPYDETETWFNRCADHGDAIGLCFNRTETEWFDNAVWQRADGVLFKRGRIKFYKADGTLPVKGGGPGAGSVFVAYGENNAKILEQVSKTTIPGKFIRL